MHGSQGLTKGATHGIDLAGCRYRCPCHSVGSSV